MFTRFLLVIAAAFLALPPPALAQEEQTRGITSLPRRCGICHLERIEAAAGAVNFLSLRTRERAGEEEVCYSCHNGVVMDSRRSAWTGRQHRASGREVEPAPGGDASCGTCHDPHVQEEGVATFMRYREGSFGHCVTCHATKVTRGHTTRTEGRDGPACGSCHVIHGAPGRSLGKTASPNRLCTSCHTDNPSREETGPGQDTHPSPKGEPGCDSCHTVHGRSGPMLVRGSVEDSTLCRQCHESHGTERRRQRNHPLSAGAVECLSCHRMHNGSSLDQNPALLKVASGELDGFCRSCHEGRVTDKKGWNHPLGGVLGALDSPKLKKLRTYGGRVGPAGEVLCVSCHKSHNAFRGTAGLVVKPEALCLYCHEDQNSLAPNKARFGTHPISVKPKNASISPLLLEAGGTLGLTGELACVTCHRTHGGVAGTAGLVVPREEYSCTLCHTAESGIVETLHRSVEAEGDPCLGCHDNHGWAIPLDEVQMGGGVVEKICWYCHGAGGSAPMSGYFGHVVGIPPSSPIRERELPLFWSDGRRLETGLITCATCHDVHRSPAGHFLRIGTDETRSDLCFGCHRNKEAITETKHDVSLYFPQEKNRRGETAAATGPCGACHVVHSGGPGESWARDIVISPGEPGELAVFCATCHSKGSFAQGKVVKEKGHPPPEVLALRPDASIVDCNGCHDPHTWNPLDPRDKGDFFAAGDGSNSFLVKPADERSRLCLSCHAEQESIRGTSHDQGGEGKDACRSCHLPHGGDQLLMWAAPLDEKDDFGTGTCLGCHGSKGSAPFASLSGHGHPIGVNPGPDTGQDLPRFNETGRRYFRGNVACATCHDPHTWSPLGGDAPATPGPATSFLRLPADGFAPLCFPCHANRSLVVGTDHDLRITAPESVNLDGIRPDESGVCGACHKVHGASLPLALWNRETGPGMDPYSTYCQSCHTEGGMQEATLPQRLEAHLVDYPGRGLVSRPFTKRQSSFFSSSAGLELYNEKGEKAGQGSLSCATCHDAHRWEPDTTRSGTGVPVDGDLKNSFLRVRNTFTVGQAFCRECHTDDTLEYFQRYHDPSYRDSP